MLTSSKIARKKSQKPAIFNAKMHFATETSLGEFFPRTGEPALFLPARGTLGIQVADRARVANLALRIERALGQLA
jgi:hypothetical protein